MSRRSDHLLAAMFGEDLNITHNPTAGTTCVATLTVPNGTKSRITLTSILVSETNVTATDHTAIVSVRAASIAGTVLAQHQMIVRFGDYDGLVWPCYISAPVGQDIVIEFGTPAASITQKVAACGYVDRQRNV